jgi:Putative adhesin
MTRRSLFMAALLVGTVAQADTRTSSEAFRWSGRSGGIVHLRDLHGSIRIVPSTDGQLRVVATAWERSTGEKVAVQVVRKEQGEHMTFCVMWPAKESSCEADGSYAHRQTVRDAGRTRVDLEVQLPSGVTVDAETVNGNVAVEAPATRVSVATVNGSIDIKENGGPLSAQSVNGDVRVQIAGSSGAAIQLATVNGNVELAAGNGELVASTVNGGVEVDGQRLGRSARHQLGKGARSIRAETVNGLVKVATR